MEKEITIWDYIGYIIYIAKKTLLGAFLIFMAVYYLSFLPAACIMTQKGAHYNPNFWIYYIPMFLHFSYFIGRGF